jgi:hypothetical protein
MPSINEHFRREAKLLLLLLVAPIVVGIVAAMVVPNVLAWREAKRCQEAGGSYDQSSEKCVRR